MLAHAATGPKPTRRLANSWRDIAVRIKHRGENRLEFILLRRDVTKVHTADIQDRAAVPLLLEGVAEHFPRIAHLWVDQGVRHEAPHHRAGGRSPPTVCRSRLPKLEAA